MDIKFMYTLNYDKLITHSSYKNFWWKSLYTYFKIFVKFLNFFLSQQKSIQYKYTFPEIKFGFVGF